MSVQIIDNSGTVGGVAVNTDHEIAVAPTTDFEKAGIVGIAYETNAGGEGIGRKVIPADGSNDFRLRVGIDSTLWRDTFSHTVVNTSKYQVINTTMTNTLSGGRWILNNGASVASAVGTIVKSYMSFALNLSGTLYCDFEAGFLVTPQANNICEWGLMQCTGVTSPNDGVYFRLNSDGLLYGVTCSNSSESAVALISSSGVSCVVSAGTMYHYLIAVHNDTTEFWINDILVGEVNTGATLGSPMLSMSEPICFRTYNLGIVAVAQQFLIASVSVSRGDVDSMRLWPTIQCAMGNSCYNTPDGTTAGSTGSYIYSTAPVIPATTGSYLSGIACYTTLGGQHGMIALASSEADILVYSFLNPAATPAIPGKNLIIRGVTIDGVSTGAVGSAIGAVQQWSLAVGGTNVAMPADSATVGTRAGRRVPLGFLCYPASAAIGAPATRPIDINLDSPIVVESGTYLNIHYKPIVGPINAGQIFRGICFVNGYFE